MVGRRICQVLDCAGVVVEVTSLDPAVLDFIVEFFDPWFQPTRQSPEWTVDIFGDTPTYTKMRALMPADAVPQPCFAHDQQVLSMPTWASGDLIDLCDAERSCFLRFGSNRVELIADPTTRRWRFTLLCVLQEIAATRLRQTHVDLHAAAVVSAGRALLIAGGKNAGKTTLSLYLMRSQGWDWIANDRSFVCGDAAEPVVTGMPTAVKIRPPTLSRCPQLRAGLPPVSRPYLYSSAELVAAVESEESLDAVGFLALTPNQIAVRLGADTRAGAPLGALVLPEIRDGETTWAVEALRSEEIVAGIEANLYGAATGKRPATLFEQRGGGQHYASFSDIAALAGGLNGYRIRLGPDAYADDGLSRNLLRLLTAE